MPSKKRARSTLTKGKVGRPTKSVSEALDETLLTLAIQALREAHFNEISLEKLAARIGVSKPTIYRRFANRSALIEAMVEREFALLLKGDVAQGTGPGTIGPDAGGSGADDTATPTDPLDALRAYALDLFHFSLLPSTANFVGFLHQEGLANPRLVQLRHEWHVNVLNHLTTSIRQLQAKGTFAPTDPTALASLLIDLMNGALGLYPMGFSQAEALSGMSPEAYFQWRFDAFLTIAAKPAA